MVTDNGNFFQVKMELILLPFPLGEAQRNHCLRHKTPSSYFTSFHSCVGRLVSEGVGGGGVTRAFTRLLVHIILQLIQNFFLFKSAGGFLHVR